MNAPPLHLSPQELAIVQAILRTHIPTHTVWVFGSRAGGQPKPHSDLDLAIMGATPLSLDTWARLREAFDEADLPWKVDLVDWARISERFREIIARNGVLVQQGEQGKAVEDGGGACCRSTSL